VKFLPVDVRLAGHPDTFAYADERMARLLRAVGAAAANGRAGPPVPGTDRAWLC
jgi:hypothetical protein